MSQFHICILRFSSLGDIILNSSLIRTLKKRWNNQVRITWITSSEFAPLLQGHPDINNVIPFNRKDSIGQLFKQVDEVDKLNSIDLIIDQHATLRSLLIRFRFRHIPRICVDKRTMERWILTTLKLNILSRWSNQKRGPSYGELLLHRNVWDFKGLFDFNFQYGHLSDYLGFEDGQMSSNSQSFSEGFDPSSVDHRLHSKKYICICPSASFPEKRWPLQSFIKLIELLLKDDQFNELNFVILAGPNDNFCDEFNKIKNDRLINLQGKTNLLATTKIVGQALMCIGNDTGVPHIAESMRTPSLFILGPTGEQFGFYPHLNNSRAIFKNLWCRPCTTNGKGNCIRKERYCLTQISPEHVFDNAKEMRQIL